MDGRTEEERALYLSGVNVDCQDAEGFSALFAAAQEGQTEAPDEEEAATFHLLTNGSLRGSFPGQNVSRVQVWERAQYCLLIGAVPNLSYTYSNYSTNTSAAT